LSGDPNLGAVLLISLVRTGRLSDAVLAQLRGTPHEVILRYYREFKMTASQVAQVQPLLGQGGLVALYCQAPAEKAAHGGLPMLLGDLSPSGREDAAQCYFQGGHASLISGLKTDPRTFGGGKLGWLTRAHAALMSCVQSAI